MVLLFGGGVGWGDFSRRPSPDLRFSMISFGVVLFCYGAAMLLVELNHRPSPDLRFSSDFLWCCIVLLWRCNVIG